jgi:hypothetical protein
MSIGWRWKLGMDIENEKIGQGYWNYGMRESGR